MKHLSYNKMAISALAVAMALLLGFGMAFLKNNPYFTLRYVKMRLDMIVWQIDYSAHYNYASTAGGAGAAFDSAGNKIVSLPILRYEGVSTENNGRYVSRADFARQIFELRKAGYQTVTTDSLRQFKTGIANLPPKPIIIVFDDAQSESYYNADPILKAVNFAAVMFVPAERDKSDYYLTDALIGQMINTGRWDIQSYGAATHTPILNADNGNQGYFYGARRWSSGQNRLENDGEYRQRIAGDLISAKNKLQTILNRQTIAFALPTAFYLQNSDSNIRTSNQKIIIEEALKKYDFIFRQSDPRQDAVFFANYIVGNVLPAELKMVNVAANQKPLELVNAANAGQAMALPYTADFSDTAKWRKISGSFDVDNGKMAVSTPGSLQFFIDGTGALDDYEYGLTVDKVDGGDAVSLLVRIAGAGDYLACQYDKKSVLIKKMAAGEQKILNSIFVGNDYQIKDGTRLTVRVQGKVIQCFIDGKPILKATDELALARGGAGVKIWNPERTGITVISQAAIYDVPTFPTVEKTAEQLVSLQAIYGKIYNKYPKSGGREVLYSYFNTGSIEAADQLLDNEYPIDRYKPVKIENLTWTEDPYNEQYWRLGFYGLQYTRNLFFAWEKTGNGQYRDKLRQIVESLAQKGMAQNISWDYHATAFRTMALVDCWWKFRAANDLDPRLSRTLLEMLEIHGEFLADPNHYEADYNHGLDQAAALYLLAVNFPDLPGAAGWLELSQDRLMGSIKTIVDDDGVLVENSPYYHFYALQKYWEINEFLNKNKLSLGQNWDAKIGQMVDYAANILQPDGSVPTIGASMRRVINNESPFKEMSASNPYLLYTLTQGKEGKRPLRNSVYYPVAGQTIMRSGWGEKIPYKNETQLIFDVGKYRTDHSDLDALSFNLYSKGLPMMPDSGLYSYVDGPWRKYFHGTSAHNAVVVDGYDQSQGNNWSTGVSGDKLNVGNGYVWQSAQETLYGGVTHQRLISLVGSDYVLVVDKLSSEKVHHYGQMFHLYPGANISKNGLTLKATWQDRGQALAIHQLAAEGVTLSQTDENSRGPAGFCSFDYGEAIACAGISYGQNKKNATFVTIIELGNLDRNFYAQYDPENGRINFSAHGDNYTFELNNVSAQPREVALIRKSDQDNVFSQRKVAVNDLHDFNGWTQKTLNGDESIAQISAIANDLDINNPILKVVLPEDGAKIAVTKNTDLDLSDKNLSFRVKVENRSNLGDLKVILYNPGMKNYASMDLKPEIYRIENSGERLTVAIGKSKLRSADTSGWYFDAPGFDWSKIGAVEFRLSANENKSEIIEISDLATIRDQQNGKIAIVFDDGWSSLMEAARIMRKYNIKGTVSVIASAVGEKNYLTLAELKELQNDYGWNIVNHSNLHKNALVDYENNGDLAGFEKDIVDGLEFLVDNDINSAPNWYIYPNGETDDKIKQVVGKYYTFARGTANLPEVYPFSDPLEVKNFSIYTPKIRVQAINDVVSDTIDYKLTTFLMFHKLVDRLPAQYTEFNADDFEAAIRNIAQQHARTYTLSELDESNSADLNQVNIKKGTVGQMSLKKID